MKAKQTLFNAASVLFGAAVFGVGVNMFAVPNDIVQGGFTGLATMLNHLFPMMPVGLSIFLFNIPLFIIAAFRLGKLFVLKTLVVTSFFSAAIDALSPFVPAYSGDTLLAAVFCGVLSGGGLGLVLLAGATTGGTELIATLVRRKNPFVSIGRTMLFIDLLVVGLSWLVFGRVESVMYAAVSLFVSSRVIDLVLGGTEHNKLLFIITEKKAETTKEILDTIGRGVTEIDVTGGYSNKKRTLLLCAARAGEAATLNRTIKDIDPGAFTVITDAGDVFGKGFK